MAKKNFEGVCHICGEFGKLTFEHVPPHAAFNDRPVIKGTFENFANWKPGEQVKGKIQQKGAGEHTLCARCNNNTGAYYGNWFVEWTYQAFDLNLKSDGKGGISYPFHIFPLRIIKQILVMFFSTNGDSFHKAHPEVVKFILNPTEKYLKSDIRIFTYLNSSGLLRKTGVVAKGNVLETGRFEMLSEISFPPLGYLMTFGDNPPDNRLAEITHFAQYDYNDFDTLYLNLARLPTDFFLPGDYRDLSQIHKDYEQNINSYSDYF